MVRSRGSFSYRERESAAESSLTFRCCLEFPTGAAGVKACPVFSGKVISFGRERALRANESRTSGVRRMSEAGWYRGNISPHAQELRMGFYCVRRERVPALIKELKKRSENGGNLNE